jgi:hypothetical protein
MAIQEDGMLARSEALSIGLRGETLKSEKVCLLRADLSAFQVKDTTLKGQDASLRVDCGRNDAASPVGVRMQFQGAPSKRLWQRESLSGPGHGPCRLLRRPQGRDSRAVPDCRHGPGGA